MIGLFKHSCLTRSLDLWIEVGGEIRFRKSEHWPIPHAVHVDKDGRMTNWVPPGKLERPWYAVLGFEGVEKDHDPVTAEPMSRTGIVCGAAIGFWLALGWAVASKVREWRA